MDYMDIFEAEKKGLIIQDQIDGLEASISNELIEKLHESFDVITATQKRRIQMYYYDEMPFSEIAQIEGVDYKAVWKSVDTGMKKVRKYSNDFYE